jgi:hypothetical protein
MNNKPWSTTSEAYRKLVEVSYKKSTHKQRTLWHEFNEAKRSQTQTRRKLNTMCKLFQETGNVRYKHVAQAAELGLEVYETEWQEWLKEVEEALNE